MIKLAVFDIDGTLVAKGNRKLQQSTIKALQNLQKQGIKLAIASGRPPFFMDKRLVEQVAFDYYICSNGACLLGSKLERVWSSNIAPQTVENTVRIIVDTNSAGSFIYTDNVYAYHGLDMVKKRMVQYVGTIDHLIDNTEKKDHHFEDQPFASLLYTKEEYIDRYRNAAPELLFERFGEECFDVYPKGINKGTGVIQICEKLGISTKDTICFGDDINDIEMLKVCGTSVVMGSSSDEVKAYGDYITKSAEEDGVGYALEQLHLLQED